jgi:hypothetical protein
MQNVGRVLAAYEGMTPEARKEAVRYLETLRAMSPARTPALKLIPGNKR